MELDIADGYRIVNEHHAGLVTDEVIGHPSGLMEARMDVTVEAHAAVPEGSAEDCQRIVIDNNRILKFKS